MTRIDGGKVCAVVTEESTRAAIQAIKRAASQADAIEIRLDYLTDFDFSDPQKLEPLFADKLLPVIITCRSLEEGGRQRVNDEARLRLLVEGARRFADFCDIEAAHYDEAMRLRPDLSRMIVSYHDFDGTPSDLSAIYERVLRLPAAVHKIITRAGSVNDSIPVFRLLDRAAREGHNLIALAMGEPGLITRLLGPGRGSFLTYASLGAGRESAAGQPSCDDLKRLYRVDRVSRETTVTGLIGRPVTQSASPAMHNAAFAELGLDFVYLPIEVDDLDGFFRGFVRADTREIDWPLRGLSVTIPHKVAVMPLLDEVVSDARRVGAVNTVLVDRGRLVGYNTDVAGAMEPLERVCNLAGERSAVIGSGGAARAVICGLLERGAHVTVFARQSQNKDRLVREFGTKVLPVGAIESSDASIIINATPVGMRSHSEGSSPVSRRAFAGRRVAYDLVYAPLETRFLEDAREQGCKTISGVEMLVAQAALQFEIWSGQKPPVDLMRRAALERIRST